MPEKPVLIKSALISVYDKTGIDEISKSLESKGVIIYSTGGTWDFLESIGVKAEKIEDLTSYPSILGGRVKTLHPKVFGGILGRRDNESDVVEMADYDIPPIDLVIVDLYPFEETLRGGGSEEEIIEKIDIGGISLIRAAAKNFDHVTVIPSRNEYHFLRQVLESATPAASYQLRRQLAARSFEVSSSYDRLIGEYLCGNRGGVPFENRGNAAGVLSATHGNMGGVSLRYGENPHQSARFIGNLDAAIEKIQGKDISYNNLVDLDAAVELVAEFTEPAFGIIKHTNPCGLATNDDLAKAWEGALAGDPVSAFGGILAANREIDRDTADGMDSIFFEVCAAPSYTREAIEILSRKKNRIIVRTKEFQRSAKVVKSVLNGTLEQDRDTKTETTADLKFVTDKKPTEQEIEDLLFANKIAKHAKSNTIVLVKDRQLIGIGVGQTSRVDALRQAIAKAGHFGFSLKGAVMASDAFFPFPDCVEIAFESGITAVIQPGGSVRDQESIDYCNKNGMAMAMTGYRHFKH